MTDLETALKTDRTIDIITVGAKSGKKRTTEIWFTNIEERIIICGTPSSDGARGRYKPRDWLANLKANPAFQFCFKESIKRCIPARAMPIVDIADRTQIMSAPETSWYRERGFSIDDLVAGSPIVEITFLGDYSYLNRSPTS
jgi:MinD-like ATPase involved in chromosome partitioning or flagellar assembly